jgi:RNA polymerase sigma factor (sigma-70 family)
MMFEQGEVRRLLRRVVRRVTSDVTLHEDLMQEACIHLWLREKRYPGQRPSWYLQSCRFHLQNVVRKGRSVDFGKHRRALCLLAEQEGTGGAGLNHSANDAETPTLVSARDLMSELSRWLTPLERRILCLLADGLGMREIAHRLRLSHTSVIKHRRKIAALAHRLGIEPIPEARVRELPRANGKSHPHFK